MLRHVKEKRAEQLQNLKEWCDEVNKLDCSSAGNAQNAKITVINDADLEGPPRHMTYMNSYKVSTISKKHIWSSNKTYILASANVFPS